MKLPEFPSVDFSKFDIDALRNMDFPKFSKFAPQFDLPGIDTEKFTSTLRDAAYVLVGLGVLGVQKVQEVRGELVKSISDRFGASKTHVETLLGNLEASLDKLDERINAVEAKVDTVVDKLGDVLPEQAVALIGQARDLRKSARQQVLGLIRNAA